MRDKIKAILRECPDHSINQVGPLWQLRAGRHSGARENGVSLAQDLLAKWRTDPQPVIDYHMDRDGSLEELMRNPYADEPVPVEIPAFLQDAEDVAALKAELAALKAERDEVPEGLKEFVREGEPHGEAQTRLWKLYTELTGKMMLKLATSEETRTHTRLHGALYWVSRGAVDVI